MGSTRVLVTVTANYNPLTRLVPFPTRQIVSSSARTILGYVALDNSSWSSGGGGGPTPTASATGTATVTGTPPTATITDTPTNTPTFTASPTAGPVFTLT